MSLLDTLCVSDWWCVRNDSDVCIHNATAVLLMNALVFPGIVAITYVLSEPKAILEMCAQ